MKRLLACILTAAVTLVGAEVAGSAGKTFTFVDLQPKANVKLADNLGSEREGNNLSELPKGEQTFAGVTFRVGDAMLPEDVADAGFGQDVGEREPVVPREAGADRLQAGH